MLANKNRLSASSDFEKVKKAGKVVQGKNLALAVLSRGDTGPSRFGFVVSTKISKLAVMRNNIKRSLREAVRQNLSYLKNGFDCVFLVKAGIVKLYTTEIMVEAKEIMKSANLFS